MTSKTDGLSTTLCIVTTALLLGTLGSPGQLAFGAYSDRDLAVPTTPAPESPIDVSRHLNQKWAKAAQILHIRNKDDIRITDLQHLIFLHDHAIEQYERKIVRETVAAIDINRQKDPQSFPSLLYIDAILNYPTPELLIGFANGFLFSAERSVVKNNLSLDDRMTRQGAKVRLYYTHAQTFYRLALAFSKAINARLSNHITQQIADTVACVDRKLANFETDGGNYCPSIEISLSGI